MDDLLVGTEPLEDTLACPQTVEDEVLRMIIGLGTLPLFLRLFELLDFSKAFGVIYVCMLGMLKKMLAWMIPMLFLDLAFSVAFSVMGASTGADHSRALLTA